MTQRISLYYVNPGERRWEKYFERDGIRPSPKVREIGEEKWYRGLDRVLATIHLNEEDEGWVERQWNRLDTNTQEKALWLVVSGAGYPATKTWSQ